MESILEGHKTELHTDLQTQLEALENGPSHSCYRCFINSRGRLGLRTDSNAKQEEVLSQITAIVQDQAATAIANVSRSFQDGAVVANRHTVH